MKVVSGRNASATFILPLFLTGRMGTIPHLGNEQPKPLLSLGTLSGKSWTLLILIPLIITFMVRTEPMRLAPLERAAESSVMSQYRSAIAQQVAQQYPGLLQEQLDAQAAIKLEEFLKANKAQANAQIQSAAQAIKEHFQYPSGEHAYAYLGDIDSYYWLRQARNIVEKGSQCDAIENGICYDTYTLAPLREPKQIDYYPFVIVAVYGMLRPFNPDISLMQASFLTPLVFSLLFTVPLFLLLRRIGGNIVAVIGSVLVSVNPYVLNRSLGSDNDIVNIFFQVVFLWLAVECFASATPRRRIAFGSMAGITLAVYSRFWGGWWYLADLFLASLAVRALFLLGREFLEKKRLEKATLITLRNEAVIPCLACIIPLIVLYGFVFATPADLGGMFMSQLSVLRFDAAANINLWPNVLTTVAEFNNIGVGGVISAFGSFWKLSFYLIALAGIAFLLFPTIGSVKRHPASFLLIIAANVLIYTLLMSYQKGHLFFLLMLPVLFGMVIHARESKERGFHPDAVFLLTSIICLVSYFSLSGIRFLFLMAVPVSLFAALGIERAARLLFSFLRGIARFPKPASTAMVALVAIIFLIGPVKEGYATAQSYMPSVSDEWVDTLSHINASSKPDAIINSWWDFGHWFKYFADRRVTLDGSSQNNPQLHWLGKLLLTDDERMAVGILRMLDCGGNSAFDRINGKLNDTPKAIEVLNLILVTDRAPAESLLISYGFSRDELEGVLSFTHCSPPENFLITSDDMIGKAGVWAHFGSWDFKKAYLAATAGIQSENEIIQMFAQNYNTSHETTRAWIQELSSLEGEEQINTWIGPWPSYYSGISPCEKKENGIVCVFSQNNQAIPFAVDVQQEEVRVGDPQSSTYAASAAFIKGNAFRLVKREGNVIPVGIIVIQRGEDVFAMFTHPALVGSMFTRLFFFEGIGLSSFEKFHDATTVFGSRIITWKVRWE